MVEQGCVAAVQAGEPVAEQPSKDCSGARRCSGGVPVQSKEEWWWCKEV